MHPIKGKLHGHCRALTRAALEGGVHIGPAEWRQCEKRRRACIEDLRSLSPSSELIIWPISFNYTQNFKCGGEHRKSTDMPLSNLYQINDDIHSLKRTKVSKVDTFKICISRFLDLFVSKSMTL